MLHVLGLHMTPLVGGPHTHSTVVLSPAIFCCMNQGGHGSVYSSLGAGTKQCSWSLPATTAGKQISPTSTSHQMNICKTDDQNLFMVVAVCKGPNYIVWTTFSEQIYVAS